MAAYFMPGTTTSMPYFAVPLTFDGASRRCTVVLPISVNLSGLLSATFWGTGSCDATVARLPYVAVRPDESTTVPAFVVNVDGSTPHRFAAACTSIARAVAPAWRSGNHESRIEVLPPVFISFWP